jgi:hypothetical protein
MWGSEFLLASAWEDFVWLKAEQMVKGEKSDELIARRAGILLLLRILE